LVRTVDFRNVIPWEPIEFADEHGNIFRCPPFKSKSDLASIPQPLWSTGLTPFGSWARACIPHDGGYQDWLEKLVAGPMDERLEQSRKLRSQAEWLLSQAAEIEASCWTLADLSKDDSDSMLLDLMTADQVPDEPKKLIYEGVHLGGWKAYRDDRAKV